MEKEPDTTSISQAMGAIGSRQKEGTFHILVKTGDKKGASTDGNIYFTMKDGEDNQSDEILLDQKWRNDFKPGATDRFKLVAPRVKKPSHIHIRTDDTFKDEDWYVETIIVENAATKESSLFPMHRWVKANNDLWFEEFDSTLPQNSSYPEQRKQELKLKRQEYELIQKIPGAPQGIKTLPKDEMFRASYQSDIDFLKLELGILTKFIDLTTSDFKSMDEFTKVYRCDLLAVPYGEKNWTSDAEFGNQRLSGCNPTSLTRCEEIPPSMATTEAALEPFLEGMKFSEAVAKKKIYQVDHRYLAKIECSEGRRLCGPMCLLYSQKGGDLVPIAIQLMPEPAEDNPVFYPSDPKYTWLAAKMWFNNADASHHQSITHLGMTHLVMEAVVVITNRQLSPSHPIFRLLAPHFLYLLSINTAAVSKLVSPGGWVDQTMTIGRVGMFNIIKENWADWSIATNGFLPTDLKDRGVDDPEALPNYHYRDDAILLWDALHKFVVKVVNKIYDTPEKLSEDFELQNWAKELTDPDAGNFTGIPTSFTNTEELSHLLVSCIFICSVSHATANFNQYDEYGFPPNYPAMLRGERPKDKSELSEADIIKTVPEKKQVLSVMTVTKLLSTRGTNALTDYEMQYAHDPITVEAIQGLKADLEKAGSIIDQRNASRVHKYPYLHPNEVPNAISI